MTNVQVWFFQTDLILDCRSKSFYYFILIKIIINKEKKIFARFYLQDLRTPQCPQFSGLRLNSCRRMPSVSFKIFMVRSKNICTPHSSPFTMYKILFQVHFLLSHWFHICCLSCILSISNFLLFIGFMFFVSNDFMFRMQSFFSIFYFLKWFI